MTKMYEAKELNPEVFLKAKTEFIKEEALNWVDVQIIPWLRVTRGFCDILFMKLVLRKNTVCFNPEALLAEFNLQPSDMTDELYQNILLERMNLLINLDLETMSKYFRYNTKDEVKELAELVINHIQSNTGSLSQATFEEIAKLCMDKLQQTEAELFAKTQKDRWFFDLCSDFHILYDYHGNVLNDARLYCGG